MSAETTPRRRWSSRALSVCLLAFVVLGAAVAVATDVVRVWAGHEKSWLIHHEQLEWLTSAHWDALGVRLASASLIVVGLGLVAAALLPGNRNFLPLRSPSKTTPTFLEKADAVRALRAAARRDHVLAATVRLSRRRARVKVRVVAADTDEEREILERVDAAVRERFDSFGLVRPTRLVLRAKSFRPPAPKPPSGQAPLHTIGRETDPSTGLPTSTLATVGAPATAVPDAEATADRRARVIE